MGPEPRPLESASRRLLLACFGLQLSALLRRGAASPVESKDYHVALPGSSKPIVVEVGVFVDDFFGVIDSAKNEFQMDFWLSLRWHDPRIAFGQGAGSPSRQQVGSYDQGGDDTWTPDITISNSRGLQVVSSNLVQFPNGTVEWAQRIQGTFEGNMDFHMFPFDEHKLEVKIESKDFLADVVLLRPWFNMIGNKAEGKSQGAAAWNYRQWQASDLECANVCKEPGCVSACEEANGADQHIYRLVQGLKPAFSGAPKGSRMYSGWQKARITVEFRIGRSLGRLSWTYFFPSMLLVLISFLTFSVNISDMGTRFSVSLLSLLTFEVLSEKLLDMVPNVQYNMWATLFYMYHMVFLFAMVAASGWSAFLHYHRYTVVGVTIEKVALGLSALSYVVWAVILHTNTDVTEGDIVTLELLAICTYIVLLAALGVLAQVYCWFLDRQVMIAFVPKEDLSQGPLWSFIDARVRKWDSDLTDETKRLILQRRAFERLAKKCYKYENDENPLEARLTPSEVTRAITRSGFGSSLRRRPASTKLARLEHKANFVSELAQHRFVVFMASPEDRDTLSFTEFTSEILSGKPAACLRPRPAAEGAGEAAMVEPVLDAAAKELGSLSM